MRTSFLALSLVLVACGSNGLDGPNGPNGPNGSLSQSGSSSADSSPSSGDAGGPRFACGNTTCDGRTAYCTVTYVCVLFTPDMDTNTQYGCQPLPQYCVDKKDPCSCLCNGLSCIDPFTGPPSGPSLDSTSQPGACMIDNNCV